MRHNPNSHFVIPTLTLLIVWSLPAAGDWGQGQASFQAGQFSEAAQAFQEVTETHPDWATGYFMLGQSLNMLHRRSEAIMALRKANTLDPKQAQIGYALGKLYVQAERVEEADAVLETVEVTALPAAARGDFYQTWAVARTRADRKGEALELWAAAANASPQDRGVQYSYGVALINGQRPAEAIPVLEKAIASEERTPAKVLRALARALRETDDYVRATEVLARLVAREPGSRSYLLLGEAQLGAQEYEAAIASLERADPDLWLTHFYGGQAHFFLGALEAAEAAFDRAEQETSEDADQESIWAYQARVYSGQQRYNEAAMAYAKLGDSEGVTRARENQKIKLHNLQAEAEEAEYQEILRREQEIQAKIDALLNGGHPQSGRR